MNVTRDGFAELVRKDRNEPFNLDSPRSMVVSWLNVTGARWRRANIPNTPALHVSMRDGTWAEDS